MTAAVRFKLSGRDMRGILSRHGWKCVSAAGFAFIVCAVRHLVFPDVPALQAKVFAEQEKMRAGRSDWRFGYYADSPAYECEDMRIPFGHVIRLHPEGQIKSVFPTFFGLFIGRGYLCDTGGQIIGVYRSLSPKCVESDYLESMPPPPPPKRRK
jgi:hypothetical protein